MLKLNLGCGAHVMDSWINYDIDTSHSGVKFLDLWKARLPHVDNSVDYIFSEHFIEHIPKDRAYELLKEMHRVLKPTGAIRISTPDLGVLIAYYASNQLPKMPGVWEPASACDMVNEGMRLWGHEYLYDKPELTSMLKAVGFKIAWDCKKGVSRHSELRNLEVRPQHFEMYVEAEKNPITV